MEWFKLGGWGMYPILIVGLILLGSSAFFAAQGDTRARGALDAMSKALAWFIVTATASDIISVCFALQRPEIPGDQMTRILLQGMGESLTPVMLGGTLLALAWLLRAVGQRRADQRV